MGATTIGSNTVATVHYRGTLTQSGEEFDNSHGGEPLTFLVGFEQMIPGFEAALIGKKIGDSVKFDLTADEAYGPRDPEMIQEVPLDQLPEGLAIGAQIAAQTPDGHVIPLTVTALSAESATLDMNHKLAGVALTFEVQVVDVRAASEEEISHGRINGPSGQHH